MTSNQMISVSPIWQLGHVGKGHNATGTRSHDAQSVRVTCAAHAHCHRCANCPHINTPALWNIPTVQFNFRSSTFLSLLGIAEWIQVLRALHSGFRPTPPLTVAEHRIWELLPWQPLPRNN